MGSWLKSIKITTDEMKEILYPRRFHSKEEINAYVGGDRIVCLICDKNFVRLSKHIESGHGCDPDDYRDILNIPRTVSLVTPEQSAMLSKNSAHTYHNVLTEEMRNFLSSVVHNPNGKSGEIKSSIALKEKLRAVKSKGKNAGKKHGRTMGKCHGCGVVMEISTQRVNRVTKCPDCLIKKQRECIKNWAKNNKPKIKEIQKKYYQKKRELTQKNHLASLAAGDKS